MYLTCIKSLWPEKEDFSVYRKDIGDQYIFVHMLTEGEFWIDGKWRRVSKGSCLITSPFHAQGVRACGVPLLHDWFHLSGDNAEDILKKYGICPNTVYTPPNSDFITHDIREAELAFLGNAPFSKELAALLTEILFAHLGNALADNTVKESPYLFPRFAELRSELLLRYNEPCSVAEMARSLSLSPSRFHRLYKSYFGVSPARDVQNARTEHAKLLLLQKGMSVTEAAERLGYNNVYHFIRQFKDHTGVTPGAYQKALRF